VVLAVALAVLPLCLLGAPVTVLARRDRRRFGSPDTARVEARADREPREACGRVRLANRFVAQGALGALRDRDHRDRH
jgi:hypothetical protein